MLCSATARRAEPDAKTTSWQVPGTDIEVVLLATAVPLLSSGLFFHS